MVRQAPTERAVFSEMFSARGVVRADARPLSTHSVELSLDVIAAGAFIIRPMRRSTSFGSADVQRSDTILFTRMRTSQGLNGRPGLES